MTNIRSGWARVWAWARACGGAGAARCLLVGQAQPAEGLAVELGGLGQRDADRRGAEVLGGLQAAVAGQGVGPSAAGRGPCGSWSSPAPRRRSGAVWPGTPSSGGPRRWHRADGGQGGQHRVQDGSQVRSVGVLAVDERDGLGRQEPMAGTTVCPRSSVCSDPGRILRPGRGDPAGSAGRCRKPACAGDRPWRPPPGTCVALPQDIERRGSQALAGSCSPGLRPRRPGLRLLRLRGSGGLTVEVGPAWSAGPGGTGFRPRPSRLRGCRGQGEPAS